MSFIIIIPTYNAEKSGIERLLISINKQSIVPSKICIIDSSSTDNTVEICRKYGCEITIIDKSSFNHGLTRQKGIDNNKNYDYAVFMTQDILLKDNRTLETLLSSFKYENVSIAYGRQLTDETSSYIEKISRQFNYPSHSIIKSKDDINKYGISTAFCSDSFAAYKIKDLLAAGGFPKTDFAEDMLAAAKIILSGKKVYYNAEAEIFHSHPYSIKNEYVRGRAIGKMHKENKWLIDTFGRAENKGKDLLHSLSVYKKALYIVQALPKLIGYKIGKLY